MCLTTHSGNSYHFSSSWPWSIKVLASFITHFFEKDVSILVEAWCSTQADEDIVGWSRHSDLLEHLLVDSSLEAIPLGILVSGKGMVGLEGASGLLLEVIDAVFDEDIVSGLVGVEEGDVDSWVLGEDGGLGD